MNPLRTPLTLAHHVMIGFMTLITLPLIYQCINLVSRNDFARWSEIFSSTAIEAAPRRFESDFLESFVVTKLSRGVMTYGPVKSALQPPSNVLVGSDGFLFLRDDIRASHAPGYFESPHDIHSAAARNALLDLNRRYARRGIHLVIVPAPAKSSIYPDKLDPFDVKAPIPSHASIKPDQEAYFNSLRAQGLDILDVTDAIFSLRTTSDQLLYYRTDTHWTQLSIDTTAARIAQHIAPHLTDLPRDLPFKLGSFSIHFQGDLGRISHNDPSAPKDTFDVCTSIFGLDGSPLNPGNEAPVLLMGDSFAAIQKTYTASLSHHLMAHLRLPVQSTASMGATDFEMRNIPFSPGFLEHKRVVVLVLAVRHLFLNDWPGLPPDTLPASTAPTAP